MANELQELPDAGYGSWQTMALSLCVHGHGFAKVVKWKTPYIVNGIPLNGIHFMYLPSATTKWGANESRVIAIKLSKTNPTKKTTETKGENFSVKNL